MKRFALLGQHIAESLSPSLHQHAWSASGTIARYDLWSLAPDELSGVIERARKELAGFNLTAPYKRQVIPYLDEQTPRARLLGSVNTVRVEKGRLIGENTDIEGVKKTLAMLPPKRGSALILGAGGVLSSVVSGLVEAGFSPIHVCARNPLALDALPEHLADSVFALPFDQRHDALPGQVLVVNATPLGSRVQDPLPLDSAYANGPYHWDLVYRFKGTTQWVELARKIGVFALDGRLMLREQAIESQCFWGFGRPEAESMRRLSSFE